MKRVYKPYTEWEETHAGLWKKPSGAERQVHIERCKEFMQNTKQFKAAMTRAVREWPISCAVNFSARSINRVAWLGHAACCIAIGCPEEPTRAAWWLLTQEQRDAANAAAEAVIKIWESKNA